MTAPVPDHASRAHAALSPSAAKRWMNCPGSIWETANIPRQSSKYAAEGTAAHELADICGQKDADPASFLGTKITADGMEFEVTREMVEAVRLYLETIRAEVQPGDALMWEQRYPLPFLPGANFGTADATLYNPAKKTLRVFDLKYGAGQAVEAVENPQALLYAGGAVWALGVPLETVEVVIVQPRAYHFEGPVRRWTIPATELSERLAGLADAAEKALAPNSPRIPGPWCRDTFCPAQATCAALSMFALAETQMIFADEPPDASKLDNDQIADLLEKAFVIRAWVAALEGHAHALMLRGEKLPGWKLVEKRATRKWVDPVQAQSELVKMGLPLDEAAPREVVSPAQAEKLLPKVQHANIKSLAVPVSSGTTIAPKGDRRPEVNPAMAGGDYSAAFAPIETD